MKEQIQYLFFRGIESFDMGFWLTGVRGEGEFIQWRRNGELYRQRFYKDGEEI